MQFDNIFFTWSQTVASFFLPDELRAINIFFMVSHSRLTSLTKQNKDLKKTKNSQKSNPESESESEQESQYFISDEQDEENVFFPFFSFPTHTNNQTKCPGNKFMARDCERKFRYDHPL
jgi:hypothetical protein